MRFHLIFFIFFFYVGDLLSQVSILSDGKWFKIGVERLVVGSLIVNNPNLVKEAIKKYPGKIPRSGPPP